MNRKFMNFAAVGIGVLGLAGLNSCLKVDETYDLEKDFDMTITVGGDLSVPGSSTEKIKLDELLDLEEGSVVAADETDGKYYLKQDGTTNNTNIEIPAVNITTDGGFTGVEIDGVKNMTGSDANISNGNVTFTNKNITINVKSDGVSSVVKDIIYAKTNCTDTYVVLSLQKTGNANINAKVSSMKVTFPEFFKVETSDPDWEVINDRELSLKTGSECVVKGEIKIPINITYIDFAEGTGAEYILNPDQNVKNQNTIELIGSINLNGTMVLNGTLGTGASANLKIDVESQNINVYEVNAVVEPDVNIEIEPIKIDNVPDFLNDEDVAIVITDPRLFFTVTNPTPMDITLSALLKPMKSGNELENVELDNIVIPAGCEDYVICLHQNPDFDSEITANDKVIVADLNNIIKNIPEEIKMEDIDVKLPTTPVTINTGKTFTMVTDYMVKTPLMFSEGTYIKYTETIDGWDADLEDMEFNSIAASMTVHNAVPLGINLTAIAIDKNGNKLENVEVDLDMDIEAGSENDPTEQNVEFTISTNGGSIKGLDGIKLTAVAEAGENTGNVAMNKEQYMQFTDIKLGLKGGITMDLN